MFDETLLDSSPSRAPVLRGMHWLISIVVGALTFCAIFFVLPRVPGLYFEPPPTRVLITQGAILGVSLMCFVLMLCYVFADARHMGSSAWAWLAVAFLLNVLGFLVYLVYSAAKTGEWKRATIPIAYIVEVLLVGVMILAPLIYTEALPRAQLMTFLVAPPPPPPPPPPPAAEPPRMMRRVSAEDIMKAPTVVPKSVGEIREAPPAAVFGVVGGIPGGMPGGTPGGVLGSIITSAAAAPPPPPPPQAATPRRIRVGGQVTAAKQIFGPKPEYPPLAKMARIQGTVRLEAIISRDGTIQDLRVISGHPLLVKAALEAVQRWRYQPTLLNGEPVEVITEIEVNFTLAQ